MIFPVVMYGCKSRRLSAEELMLSNLWFWRRLLTVPWTARRSSQLILKETSPKYSLEGLVLKLKLQYFGHLMQRTDSFEKCWRWNETPTPQSGLNLCILTPRFLQLLYFISFAQQSTGQVAKHYDLVTDYTVCRCRAR